MAGRRAVSKYGVQLVRGPDLRLPPHERSVSTLDDLIVSLAGRTRPRAVDLFSGAGGLSLGLEEAGFDVVCAVDHDERALETHRHQFGGLTVNLDLGDEASIEFVAELVRTTNTALLAGGPPCQPFSKAGRSMLRDLVRTGRRESHDKRRDLWQGFLSVIERSRPAAVLMENVPDMALDRDMLIVRTMVDELEAAGYGVHVRLLETWRYGVPQFRTRLILVALLGSRDFEWPATDERITTVDDAISDLPPVAGGARPEGGAHGWWSYQGASTGYQKRARRSVPDEQAERIYDHITRPVRDDDLLAFQQMSSDTRYSDLDNELKRYREDIFEDKYKRLSGDGLSRTITAHIAKDGYWYIHPTQHRTLTVREAARLQTFPDSFRFAGPPSAAFRQIGNAVPPLLAERLGAGLMKALSQEGVVEWSTREVSTALSAWYQGVRSLRVPWLRSGNRWLALACELLFDRLPLDLANYLWQRMQKFDTPASTIANESRLHALGSAMEQPARIERLLDVAGYFSKHPDALGAAQGLEADGRVPKAVAERAARVVPLDADDPIVASAGILRVAARFTGSDVDVRNKLSDGRMTIARIVGVDPVSDQAHLALFELAASHCSPGRPSCGGCPLATWCRHGSELLAAQPTLF